MPKTTEQSRIEGVAADPCCFWQKLFSNIYIILIDFNACDFHTALVMIIASTCRHITEYADINLSHCVGQYIERVANGECHILFLRYRDIPEESLVTLQLSGKQICQAQGMNRRPLTTQEYRFLKQWGREKEIEIAV